MCASVAHELSPAGSSCLGRRSRTPTEVPTLHRMINDIHVGRQDDHRFKFAVSVCTLS
jgi:hypothetical protein